MSDEQTNAISAPFPAPPPFYKYFTAANLALLENQQSAVKAEPGQANVESGTEGSASELRFLVPPQPPPSGRWNVFGTEYTLDNQLRSLEENNISRLYPAESSPESSERASTSPRPNHAHIVVHIVRSILLNFLELSDILAKDPKMSEEKIGDLRTLFYNAHHLLNEYRPHQARETLISMMEDRIAGMRADIQDVKDTETKVGEMLSGLGKAAEDGAGPADPGRQNQQRLERSRIADAKRTWKAMKTGER